MKKPKKQKPAKAAAPQPLAISAPKPAAHKPAPPLTLDTTDKALDWPRCKLCSTTYNPEGSGPRATPTNPEQKGLCTLRCLLIQTIAPPPPNGHHTNLSLMLLQCWETMRSLTVTRQDKEQRARLTAAQAAAAEDWNLWALYAFGSINASAKDRAEANRLITIDFAQVLDNRIGDLMLEANKLCPKTKHAARVAYERGVITMQQFMEEAERPDKA